MAGKEEDENWRQIAEEMQNEQDQEKLFRLVSKLCEGLDRDLERKGGEQPGPEPVRGRNGLHTD